MSEPHQQIMKKFYAAAEDGNLPLLDDLLAKGARLNKGDNFQITPFK